MRFDRSGMEICLSHWPQIMKADSQKPKGIVLGASTSVFSELHSLPIASVNLSSVYFLSAYVSFFIFHWLPFSLLTIIPFDPFCILSCNICHVRAEADLRTLLGLLGWITHFFFVPLVQRTHLWYAQEDRVISGNGLSSITLLLWREIFRMH